MPSPSDSSILYSHEGEWLTAKEIAYPADFRLPRHQHDDNCIQVVLSGVFHENGWGDNDHFHPGETLFRPAGFSHANAQGGKSSVGLSIRLGSLNVPAQITDTVRGAPPFRAKDPHLGFLAARLCREMNSPQMLSGMIIEALCAEIVVLALRSAADSTMDSRSARLAGKAVDLIRQGLSGTLLVDSLAREVGTDRFTLNRAFLKHQGCCPAEFIRMSRVEMAQRLLLQTNLPISAIAIDCGFADQSHMTKAFRRAVGVSPARFRTDHGKG